MQSLFKLYMESGEDWNKCSLVQNNTRVSKRVRTGNEVYKTYRSLVQEHGQDAADKIRSEKKSLQSRFGDAYEDCPYWMKHPDLRDLEVF